MCKLILQTQGTYLQEQEPRSNENTN